MLCRQRLTESQTQKGKKKIQTHSKLLLTAAISLLLSFPARAGEGGLKRWESERFTWGGDVRIRATQIHRNVFSPDGMIDRGPDVQWFRFRKRLWFGYHFTDDLRLDLRLANRWHYVTSHFLSPNNQERVTWRFPDEVIFDQLKLTWHQVADLPVHLTMGRQDLILGNGMIILEGTPYDQGRGIYFDGLRATWRENDTNIDAFGFFSGEEDDFLVINNLSRRLRRGDTLLAGIYWTQNVAPQFNTDLYYIYNTVRNDIVVSDNVCLNVVGARLFGTPHELIDYSAELAMQRGQLQRSGRDMTGMMTDLRLGVLLPGDLPMTPKIKLQHTWLRGDNRNRNTFTGWHPVAAEYPIWREELMPIATGGNWTNLNKTRIEGNLQLHERLAWTGAYAYLLADTASGYLDPTGRSRGRHIGHLYSCFFDYTASPSWTLRLEGALLQPGNYFASSTNAHWLRLEGLYRF